MHLKITGDLLLELDIHQSVVLSVETSYLRIWQNLHAQNLQRCFRAQDERVGGLRRVERQNKLAAVLENIVAA